MYSAGPSSLLLSMRRFPLPLFAFVILYLLTHWQFLRCRATFWLRVLLWAKMFAISPRFAFATARDWPAGWPKPGITSSMAIPRLNRGLKDRELLRCAQPWRFLCPTQAALLESCLSMLCSMTRSPLKISTFSRPAPISLGMQSAKGFMLSSPSGAPARANGVTATSMRGVIPRKKLDPPRPLFSLQPSNWTIWLMLIVPHNPCINKGATLGRAFLLEC